MEIIVFNEDAIMDFLCSYGKGPESKDYEFIASIILSKFCQEQWNEKCVIGFSIKNKYSRYIPSKGSASIDQIRDILRKQIEEDTPIDVIIAPGPLASGRIKGESFQLKRLGKNFGNAPKKDTQFLIDYLNEIPKKYARTNASLFLILEIGGEIDLMKINKSISVIDYPFKRIMFMLLSNGQLFIGEIWPNAGMNKYDPKQLLSS